MNANSLLRIGIIGAGRIGRVHADAVAEHPRARLVLVCDPVGTAAEDLAARHGARHCKDAAEVFADDEVDAVIIGSPTPFHAEHVLAAARAGKAALCEKPVAIDVAEGRQLESDLAALDHPPIMLGFNRRFDPSFARARRLVAEGAIGRIEQMTVVSRDPAPPPASYVAVSGGIFKDMAIHDFDFVRFFLGDIAEVTAIGQKLIPELAETGDFTAVTTVVRSRDGAVATITNNRPFATGYDQRTEVHGETGSVWVDNLRPTAVQVNTAQYSGAEDRYLDFFLERFADAYRAELSAFVDAVVDGTPVSPTVADGVEALVLAEAAAESASTGRTVSLG